MCWAYWQLKVCLGFKKNKKAKINKNVSNSDQISIQNKLEFQNSLKDLKKLSKQLYSAAEYFETSYDQENRQQYMIESWKDYVTKSLVNTIDHLGSVADKLNTFMVEKCNEFLATNARFSCIEQRLSTFQGFVNFKGVSQHSLMIKALKHHKQYNVPNNFQSGVIKPPLPFLRKNGPSRISTTESSPKPVHFSFTRLTPNKEPGKRSISPLDFSLMRPGSAAAISKPEKTNNERETEPNTKKSKHLFKKGLFDVNRSRK